MKADYLKRKEKIIITAIDLLDELGINGLTMKEIANRQDITEPAVYKQFDSKMDIVMTILDQFSIFDTNIKNTILSNRLEGKEGIRYFVRVFAEYYQSYPQITTVMFSFDAFRYQPELNKKMMAIMAERREILQVLIRQAIDKGEIRNAKDLDTITDAVFGAIWSTTFLWKMGNGDFDLKKRIIDAADFILDN